MVRRTRIVVAAAATAAGILSGAALAPAAGDRNVTGASERLSYTADGIPYVDEGPQCRGGGPFDSRRKHRKSYDASDY
jgi:hypothetical protein